MKDNILACELTLFLVSILLIGCDNSDYEPLPQPDENGYIWLRDVKSLTTIKNTIRGSWKIHYAYGGYTGHGRIDLKDSRFSFVSNDSMYIVFESDQYAATKANFVRKQTEFGYEAWILDFEFINAWGLRDELIIDTMKGDTLTLVRNAPDSYGYYMTKLP
jgi:hypothetical protein